MLVVMRICFCYWPFAKMTSWFDQPVMQLLGHLPCAFQHFCGIAAMNIWNLFLFQSMFLYMSPDLGLLQFTHSWKAAFAIWCFDLTTEFQPGMLNLPSFFLPVGLIAEDAATSRALVSSAYKFYISSRCFSSVQLKFWQCLTSVGTCSWSSRFLLLW